MKAFVTVSLLAGSFWILLSDSYPAAITNFAIITIGLVAAYWLSGPHNRNRFW